MRLPKIVERALRWLSKWLHDQQQLKSARDRSPATSSEPLTGFDESFARTAERLTAQSSVAAIRARSSRQATLNARDATLQKSSERRM